MNTSKARDILLRIVSDTREQAKSIAESTGAIFNDEDYSDEDILNALLRATGVSNVIGEEETDDVINVISEMLGNPA